MKYELAVDPKDMDGLVNTNMRQIILHNDDVHEVPEVIVITDGMRVMLCKPETVIDCYFEEHKVTIKEGEAFTPYLWSDREVVNIAMYAGLQNGDMLREKIKRYGRHMVIRW